MPFALNRWERSWRARARDAMRPLTAGALAELLMKDPDAVVLVDTVTPHDAVSLAGDDHLAAAMRVVALGDGRAVDLLHIHRAKPAWRATAKKRSH